MGGDTSDCTLQCRPRRLVVTPLFLARFAPPIRSFAALPSPRTPDDDTGGGHNNVVQCTDAVRNVLCTLGINTSTLATPLTVMTPSVFLRSSSRADRYLAMAILSDAALTFVGSEQR